MRKKYFYSQIFGNMGVNLSEQVALNKVGKFFKNSYQNHAK